MNRKILSLYLLLFIVSCDDDSSPATANGDAGKREDASTNHVSISKTKGFGGDYASGIGLCETALRLGGPAGLYRVEKMTSLGEVTPKGNLRPYTYVELTLLENWSGDAPENPVARIYGGALPDGHWMGSNVSLEVGETMGVILQQPTDKNRGYYGLDELGVFHADPEDHGYTNGYHFLKNHKSLSELREIISDVLENRAKGCTEPDIYNDEYVPPVDGGVGEISDAA